MDNQNPKEIFSARVINTSIENLYDAFANPNILKQWWGPEGFTNTFHEFDLKPEGKWILTMHGPDKKGNYENEAVFKKVIPNQLVSWTRISQPLFDMEIRFEKVDENRALISFKMIFEIEELCNKIRPFATPNNEENFDRLERLLEEASI